MADFFAGENAAKSAFIQNRAEACIQGDELPAAVTNIITMPYIIDSIENYSGSQTIVWVRLVSQSKFSGRTQYKKVVIDDKLTVSPGLFDQIYTAGAGTANYNVATVYYNQANPLK